MSWFSSHIVDIWSVVSGIVTVASVIVRVTPGKADDQVVSGVQRFLEMLALNKRK